MSSWFSYLLSAVTERIPEENEEEAENNDGQEQEVKEVPPNEIESLQAEPSTSTSIQNVLEELPEQQREHISDVLRRAEESRRAARVVVDGRHLSRYGRIRKTKLDPERRFSVEEISEDSMERGDLVQMDSIPEDTTVTISATALTSKVPLLRQYGVEMPRETSEWSQTNLKSRIEMFGKRLSKWFDTLDYDGDFMNIQWVSDYHSSTYVGQNITLFAEVLSTGVILIALFELYESSLERSYSLHSYCDNLIRTIIETIFAEFEQFVAVQDIQDITPIHEFCSQLVLHIFNEIDMDDLKWNTLDALEVPCGDTFLSRSSTASPLSACYEILHDGSDSTVADSSIYSSFEYPSEPEAVPEYADSYEPYYDVPDVADLRVIVTPAEVIDSTELKPPSQLEAVSAMAEPREPFHVVADISWLETLVATGVDVKESERPEVQQKETEQYDFWSKDLERIQEGIEQISRYEPEPLDELLSSPVSQKLPWQTDDSSSVMVGFAIKDDVNNKGLIEGTEEVIGKVIGDSRSADGEQYTTGNGTDEHTYWDSLYRARGLKEGRSFEKEITKAPPTIDSTFRSKSTEEETELDSQLYRKRPESCLETISTQAQKNLVDSPTSPTIVYEILSDENNLRSSPCYERLSKEETFTTKSYSSQRERENSLQTEEPITIIPSSPAQSYMATELQAENVVFREKLDNIAYIEKLAKETSVALEPTSRPAPPAVAAVLAEEQRPAQFDAEEVVHP
uniref:Uncharacterized protein n=1 Tax=Haemonchus contortus TaxID=6289 RepID=A0A7I4YP74_HAECO